MTSSFHLWKTKGTKGVTVPVQFAEEVRTSRPEDITQLLNDVRVLPQRNTPDTEITQRIVDAGWTRAFAVWICFLMAEHGPDIDLTLTPIQEKTQASVWEMFLASIAISAFIALGPFLHVQVLIYRGLVKVGTIIGPLCLVSLLILSLFMLVLVPYRQYRHPSRGAIQPLLRSVSIAVGMAMFMSFLLVLGRVVSEGNDEVTYKKLLKSAERMARGPQPWNLD